MKKSISLFVLVVFVLGSSFAVDLAARVEIATNLAAINLDDLEESKFLLSPDGKETLDFDESKVEFELETPMFGALIALAVDDLGTGKGTQMWTNISAWGKIGPFFKIKIGDFDDRIAKNHLRNGTLIAEYYLGILQWSENMINDELFREHIEGDRLDVLVTDFTFDPVTVSLMINHPIPATATEALEPKPMDFKNLHFGGRIYANILGFANLTATARYIDNESLHRTTVGTFIQFPNLIAGLNLVAGFTASPWIVKEEGFDITGFDYAIDLRAQMPVGIFTLATHNNLSMYRPIGDGEIYADKLTSAAPNTTFESGDKYIMLVYNEVKGKMPLADNMEVSMAVRSHYYYNPNEDLITSGDNTTKTFYDLGFLFGFSYTFARSVTMSTGVNLMHFFNDQTDLMMEIPFKLSFWL